jgi:hypothetical protein
MPVPGQTAAGYPGQTTVAAGNVVYMSELRVAATPSGTDSFAVCQNPNGCGPTDALARMSLLQVSDYILPIAGQYYFPLTGGVIAGPLTVQGVTTLGVATATEPGIADSSDAIATTNWVKAQGYGSGTGSGSVTAIVAGNGLTGGTITTTGTISLAVPVSVANGGTGSGTPSVALQNLGAAPLLSPAFTGSPTTPTPGSPALANDLIPNTLWVHEAIANDIPLPVAVAMGGTGTTTPAQAVINLGAAPIVSPALTGSPTAPTPATADNSTAISTTAFVKNQGYATLPYVQGTYLPIAGGTITGSLVVNGNCIGQNSVQSNGVYFQNNSGYFYTPQSFLSGGNVVAQSVVYAGGTGGVYFQNNGGWFYTPWSFQTNGNLQANGGSLNLAGVTVWNNNGWFYSASGFQCGNIQNNGSSQVNGNINCNNQISSNTMTTNGITVNGNVNCNGVGYFQAGGTFIQVENDAIFPFADDWGQVGFGGRTFVAMAAYGFNNPSDPRLKQDIAQAPAGALAKVCAIPVINYHLKTRPDEPLRTGFDASHAAQYLGATVHVGEDENKTLSLNLLEMTAWLWQAVQELTAKVELLEAK